MLAIRFHVGEGRGPRPPVAFAACQAGWLFSAVHTPDVARLARECGIQPIKEAIDEGVGHTEVPKRGPA